MTAAGKILVLNYHMLSADIADQSVDPVYCITTSTFSDQLRFLYENKIPVIPLADLLHKRFDGEFGVVLTFDDGYSSDFHVAYPALKKFNFPATFFPFTNSIGSENRLSWEQLRELTAAGFTVGSHGISHTVFSGLTAAQQQEELSGSKKLLEEKLNCEVEFFSPPYGWYTKELLSLAKGSGYRFVLTTGLRINNLQADTFVLHRWNIRAGLPKDTFEKIVLCKGGLPVNEAFSSGLKAVIKTTFGHTLSGRVNAFINREKRK